MKKTLIIIVASVLLLASCSMETPTWQLVHVFSESIFVADKDVRMSYTREAPFYIANPSPNEIEVTIIEYEDNAKRIETIEPYKMLYIPKVTRSNP